MDLKKAYDSVWRDKLFQILMDRCVNESERHIVQLLIELFTINKVKYGEQWFEVNRGVMQGGVISPFLFNVYLEHALMSCQVLKTAIKEGLLMAFADDLMISAMNRGHVNDIVRALASLQTSWGLSLNKTKT